MRSTASADTWYPSKSPPNDSRNVDERRNVLRNMAPLPASSVSAKSALRASRSMKGTPFRTLLSTSGTQMHW
eukprot:3769915-Alexandrium_andersonii.AAC.1